MSETHGPRILLIASNPDVSPVTGWPVGFWWSELTHAWWTFREAGYDVDIRSPKGGEIVGDGFSDPEHESGYSAHDILSLGFKRNPETAALLGDTGAIEGIRIEDYAAVYLAGGQGPMVTFVDHTPLHQLVAAFLERDKPTAVVCHATCLLLSARDRDGALLVAGRTWTGFANTEEDAADAAVGQKLQPFRIEDRARAIEGTHFVVDQPFRSFALRDGMLITGKQQTSGAAAARLVVEAVG
ncbi:MAG: type 1 glutamine amidotransferase domain-containing protein [Myxococcota bacterium]